MNLYAYTSPLVPLSSSSCTLEIEYALMCTENQLAPKSGGVCLVVTCKDVTIYPISTYFRNLLTYCFRVPSVSFLKILLSRDSLAF